MRRLSRSSADALIKGFESLGAKHPAASHWYLFFTGISPQHQGRGHGASLLAPVLEIADGARCLSYLETPFPATHAFYRRLGFEITSEGHPFEGAPTLWTMTRAPKTR